MHGHRCTDRTPRRRSPADPGRAGVALMSALVLVAVLVTSITVSVNYLWQAKRILRHDWQRKQGFHLAESGLDHAIAELLQGRNADAVRAPLSLGAGEYWATVTPEPARPGHYRIQATGHVGDPDTGPATRLNVVVRVQRLFGGASRRAQIVSWQERRMSFQSACPPAATQAGATQPAASRPRSQPSAAF